MLTVSLCVCIHMFAYGRIWTHMFQIYAYGR